jgi:hypothetical protein
MTSLATRRPLTLAWARMKAEMVGVMTDVADNVGGVLMRYADDAGVIAPADRSAVAREAGRALDGVFSAAGDRRSTVDDDGTPRSLYATLLLREVARVTRDVVGVHQRHMARVIPQDVQAWMRNSRRVVAEQEDRPLTSDELREKYRPLRLFEANPLAEYEPAHTWVDPNGYRLSERIWRTDIRTRLKLDEMLTEQINAGIGAREIARLAEQFLIPGRRKLRTRKPYGTDASFDAMRLARSEIARAANQAAFISASLNPYVEQIDVARSPWGDPECPICPQHATLGIGGGRLRPPYSIGAANLPIYHPNCMCAVLALVTDNAQEVTRQLREMMREARRADLEPVMTPLEIEEFTQTLLGDGVTFDQMGSGAPHGWEYIPERRVRAFQSPPNSVEQASRAWAEALTSEQRSAIEYWTQNGYVEYRALGRGQQLSAFSQGTRTYSHFISGMDSAPSYSGVSWRGVSVEGVGETILDNLLRQVGTSIEWDTWSSASLNAEVAGSFTRGRADVPVLFEVYSSQGRYINAASPRAGTRDDELEVVFAPGARFRVHNVFRGAYQSPFGDRDVIIVQLEDN